MTTMAMKLLEIRLVLRGWLRLPPAMAMDLNLLRAWASYSISICVRACATAVYTTLARIFADAHCAGDVFWGRHDLAIATLHDRIFLLHT